MAHVFIGTGNIIATVWAAVERDEAGAMRQKQQLYIAGNEIHNVNYHYIGKSHEYVHKPKASAGEWHRDMPNVKFCL